MSRHLSTRNISSKSMQAFLSKGKGKGLDTCCSVTYMSQTRDQQRFTISEVAADWHEPMVPQRIMSNLADRQTKERGQKHIPPLLSEVSDAIKCTRWQHPAMRRCVQHYFTTC